MTRWERFYYASVAIGLILFLAGCSTTKAIIGACRDGLCR